MVNVSKELSFTMSLVFMIRFQNLKVLQKPLVSAYQIKHNTYELIPGSHIQTHNLPLKVYGHFSEPGTVVCGVNHI